MPSYHPVLPQGHASDLMTDLDKEVIIHAGKKFRSWIEAVMRPLGFSSNKCVYYMHIKFP
jgi:hypothetical protein